MNHIYRLVWSHVTHGWVPVSELSRGRGKRSRRRLAATALALTATAAQAGPSGGQVVSGTGVITQSGATTTISQSSQSLSLNWVSFNIAPQETVNFLQPSASAIAVNRIFDTNGTQILGHLNANGQVYLVNPNGVLFGAGAQVNVGGLVASTLDFNEANSTDSQRSFQGGGSGSVINQGTITAANGGYVALLGNHVSNQGTISARLGTVALGAGSAVTLTYSKNNLVQVQVDQGVLNSVAENGGLVQADGGQVIMTAGARNALLASAVNNTGVVEARTVEDHEGTVTLLGGMTAGTVNVGGTLDASAPNGGNGGQIETSAAHVNVAPGTKVTTAAAQGLYGTWLIDPSDFTVAASGGNEDAGTLATALTSGNVILQSSAGTAGGSGNVNINQNVSWSADTTLTLTASNNVNVNASITASGANAGIAINPNTSNGSEVASGRGVFSLGSGGVINLPNVSPTSTTALEIAGVSYTVINSLGVISDTNGTDLEGIQGHLAGNYALGSNIDASSTATWNNGAGFFPIGQAAGTFANASNFTGIFDGLGHTINNLSIADAQLGAGLFSAVSGTVRNVGIVGGSVSGGSYTGALVGQLNGGLVSNSYATASVSTANVQGVGGLVGWMNGGTVENSYATGNVSATSVTNGLAQATGGLIGDMQGGNVINSHATGNVSGGQSVGGLVGYEFGGYIQGTTNFVTASVSNSYATGAVSGNIAVGGLVGANYGYRAASSTVAASISNSYATGNVNGHDVGGGAPLNLGGLIGQNHGGPVGYGGSAAVSNTYATGSVTGDSGSTNMGGLIGRNVGNYGIGTVTNSYSTGNVNNSTAGTSIGGLIGTNSYTNSSNTTFTGAVNNSYWNTTTSGQTNLGAGTGLTTAEMQAQSNFNSWDFTNTWVMYSGTNPLLIADMTPVTVTANAATRTYDGTAYSGGNGVIVTETVNGMTSTVSPSLTGLTYGGSSQGAVDAGSYAITPGGLSSSSQQGYYYTYTNGTLTVNPLVLNGTITAGSSVYGSALNPGTVTFTNAVAGNVPTATVSVNTTGNTSTSGNLKAGSYTGIESVTALSGGTNANDYTIGTITGDYSVSKLALTGSIATGSSVYGSALAPGAATFSNAITGDVVSAGTVSVNTTGNTSTSGKLKAGGYTGIESVGTTLSGADAGNYTFAGATGDYAVSQLVLTGSIAAGSSVYGSALAPGAVTFTNAVSGDVVSAAGTVSVNTTGNTSTSGNLKAGSYTGIESAGTALSGADAANYTFAGATGNYTVSPLALSASIAAGSSVYGSTLAPGAATFTNAITGDVVSAAGTVSVNTTGNTSTSGNLKAGSYTGIESVGTTLSGTDAGNYTFTGATGNYTVSQLALTGSVTAGSSVYGSALAPGAATFNNAIVGDVITGGTVSVNTTGHTSSSGKLKAGSYTGIESVTGLSGADSSNYTLAGLTGNYTVSPLALSASIAAGSSVYGSALAPGAATFSNAITGDVVSAGTVSVNTTGNTSTSGNLKAGSYTGIESAGTTLSGADAANYTFAGATGNYTVSPLALSASIATGSSVYGSALAPGAATFNNAITGDVVSAAGTVSVNTTGNTSTSGNLKAGSYTGIESVGTTLSGADASNYTFAGATGNYTVSPLALSASIAAGSSVYGSALAPGAATFSNGITGDVVSVGTVSVNTAGNFSTSGNLKAGSYTGIESVGTTLSGADAGNYTFAGATGNYTVSPRAITVAATGANKVYDGTVSDSATLKGSGVISGDLVSFSDTSATFADKNVGNGKTVSVSGISASGADGSNYVIGNTTVTTTANITPATLTYVADPTSIVASQTATGLQGSVSGFVSGDTLTNATTGTLTWFTTATPGSSPGQYAIDGSGLSATNYVFIQAAGNATALTLSPSSAPQSVIDEVALLDENLSSSKPASVKSNDLARGFSLRVVDGGVRLPDNGLSAKP